MAGTTLALGGYAVTRDRSKDRYRPLRRRLGHVILVGLEILVAGEIVRFLSTALEVEIDGRWLWGRQRPKGQTE